MKKILSVILTTLLMATFLTACSQAGESPASSEQVSSAAQADPTQSAVESEESNPMESNEVPEGGNNVLIVYYSLTGTTEGIATMLQEKTGGELFLLEPETPYSDDTAAAEVIEETAKGEIRGLLGQLPDVSAYDLILVGGPVWSGVPSNPVQKYLELTDFGGTKVAGFWTANANPGNYADRFESFVTNAEVMNGLSLVGADISGSGLDSKIDTWLATLEISE